MVVTASDKERMVTLQTSGFDGCDIEMDCAGSTLLIVEVMRFMTRYNPDRGQTDFVVTCGSEANLLPAEFYERQRKPIPKTSLNKLNVVGMKHINKAYATRIGRDSLRTFWIESGNGGGYCNGNQQIPVRVQNGGQQLISDALKNAQPLAINAFNEWKLLGYGSQTLCDNPDVAKYVASKQLLAMVADGMEAGQAMSIIEDARERMARFVMLLGGRRHDTYTLNGLLEPPSAPEPAPNYN
jgi:hypothetical protein